MCIPAEKPSPRAAARWRRPWVALAASVGLAMAVSPFVAPRARAQSEGQARGEARRILEAGKKAFAAKDYQRAAALFAQAYASDSSLTIALYNRAFCLRKAKDYKNARDAYVAYRKVLPDDTDGLFGLAETERLLGNKAAAAQLFQTYVATEKRGAKRKYVEYAQKKLAELGTSAPPAATAATSTEAFAAGTAAYRDGRFGDAAMHFARAAELDPTLLDARYRQALSLRKAKRYPESADAYRRLLAKDGGHLDGVFGLAETLRLDGDNKGAIEYFERYLASEKRADRKSYVDYAKKQLAALKAANKKPAVASTTDSNDTDTNDAAALFDAGMKEYKARAYLKAAELFSAAYTADAARVDALYRQALALRKGGELAAARQAYAAYLAQKPDDLDAIYGLAETERLAGNTKEARALFAKYVARETRPSEATYVERAKTYLAETAASASVTDVPPGAGETHAEKHARERREHQEHAHAEGPHDEHQARLGHHVSIAHMIEHGEKALADKQAKAAAYHFALALAAEPENLRALVGRGEARLMLEHAALARQDFEAVLAKDPESPEADRARSYLEGGTRTRGVQVSARAAARAAAAFAAAQKKVDEKDIDGAITLLTDEVIRSDPTHVDAHLLLGKLHLARKSGARALLAYQRALSLAPEQAEPLWGMARAYESMGERRLALHNYRLYVNSQASDRDQGKAQQAWLKLEGVQWPLETR